MARLLRSLLSLSSLAVVLVDGAARAAPPDVLVGGRRVPVREGMWPPPEERPYSPIAPPPLTSRLGIDRLESTPYVHRHGARELVRTHRHTPAFALTSDLFVVDGPRVRRHELPINDRGWAPAVCAERWLVMALEHTGTLVWDLDAGRAVTFVRWLGEHEAAVVGPPACSPDGRHVAIARPYDDEITILRLRDGARLADMPAVQPGFLRWTREGITWWWTATYGLDMPTERPR